MAQVIVGPSDGVNVRIGPGHPVRARTGGDIVPVYITIQDVRFKEIREDGSYVYTIVMTNGAEFDFVAPIGPQGVSIENIRLNEDYTLTITLDDGTEYTTAPIRGEKGETGNGIASILWIGGTHKPGEFDTYRITYTDGTLFDFQIYNGQNGKNNLEFGTTAEWNSKPMLRSQANTIYVYSDYRHDQFGVTYPGFKLGNGIGYLIDLPFIDNAFYEHMNNSEIHITQEEREFWNNKVRCYMENIDQTTLYFTTN